MEALVSLVIFVLFWVIAAVLVVAVVAMQMYNNLQQRSELVHKGRSAIQAGKKSKLDLVSQLSQIAENHASRESLTHIEVAARENQGKASDSAPAGSVVGTFAQIARAYPELKANENYQQLMSKLENVERELLRRRDSYNNFAEKYNTYRSSIPAVLFASRLGFENAPYYALGAGDDMDNLTVFKTDSGEMLKAFLGDAGRSIGDTSRQLGTGLSRRGKQLAEYGRAKLEEHKAGSMRERDKEGQ